MGTAWAPLARCLGPARGPLAPLGRPSNGPRALLGRFSGARSGARSGAARGQTGYGLPSMRLPASPSLGRCFAVKLSAPSGDPDCALDGRAQRAATVGESNRCAARRSCHSSGPSEFMSCERARLRSWRSGDHRGARSAQNPVAAPAHRAKRRDVAATARVLHRLAMRARGPIRHRVCQAW